MRLNMSQYLIVYKNQKLNLFFYQAKLLYFYTKSPTPVGPFPIKPDLENNQSDIPFHQFDLSLKAAPLHHRPQTKTYAHLQL